MPQKELRVPAEVQTDAQATEILRLWTTPSGERVALDVDPTLDVGVGGIILVDLARHVARAYEGRASGTGMDNFQRIIASFVAELRQPTDTPTSS
ncbi:MAG TPA: DUF5076 domain-containing protein [Gemmatimonadaceae bacterium]|nr:DUF5076 domain-containing protein [Gemmatimonadaceae bacterium]